MTWTYDGDPAASTRDAVRFLAGQTSTGDAELVTDEEIAWALAQDGSTYLAAASVCEALAKRYGGKAQTRTIGAMTLSYAERGKSFLEQAAALRRQGGLRGVQPYAGGISRSDKASVDGDTDRLTTSFSLGMDDRPLGEGAST